MRTYLFLHDVMTNNREILHFYQSSERDNHIILKQSINCNILVQSSSIAHNIIHLLSYFSRFLMCYTLPRVSELGALLSRPKDVYQFLPKRCVSKIYLNFMVDKTSNKCWSKDPKTLSYERSHQM